MKAFQVRDARHQMCLTSRRKREGARHDSLLSNSVTELNVAEGGREIGHFVH